MAQSTGWDMDRQVIWARARAGLRLLPVAVGMAGMMGAASLVATPAWAQGGGAHRSQPDVGKVTHEGATGVTEGGQGRAG